MTPYATKTDTFSLTLKKELIENKKALLIGVGSCWGLCMVIGAFLGISSIGGGAREFIGFASIFVIMASIIGSLMFANMKTKAGRTSTLLLPATAFDKFIVRWLALVPGLLITFIIGLYIGDASRIVASWLDGAEMGSNYYRIIDVRTIVTYMFGDPNTSLTISLMNFCGYFFVQALFMLGAILWPKLSYIKTLLALWAVEITLGSAVTIIMKLSHFSFKMLTNAHLWIVISILIVLTLVLYYLTYRRFTSSQVIYKLF